jgi:hypothetical protein
MMRVQFFGFVSVCRNWKSKSSIASEINHDYMLFVKILLRTIPCLICLKNGYNDLVLYQKNLDPFNDTRIRLQILANDIFFATGNEEF